MFFHLSVFSNVPSNYNFARKPSDRDCMNMAFFCVSPWMSVSLTCRTKLLFTVMARIKHFVNWYRHKTILRILLHYIDSVLHHKSNLLPNVHILLRVKENLRKHISPLTMIIKTLFGSIAFIKFNNLVHIIFIYVFNEIS